MARLSSAWGSLLLSYPHILGCVLMPAWRKWFAGWRNCTAEVQDIADVLLISATLGGGPGTTRRGRTPLAAPPPPGKQVSPTARRPDRLSGQSRRAGDGACKSRRTTWNKSKQSWHKPLGQLRQAAAELSKQRQCVADRLAKETQKQFAELGMAGRRLEANPRDEPPGRRSSPMPSAGLGGRSVGIDVGGQSRRAGAALA